MLQSTRGAWTIGAIAVVMASGAGAADIGSLTAKAAAAAKGGDLNASIAALEQALEQVRLEAPLALSQFTLVSRPAKIYGDVEPRKDSSFGRGEKMNFYAEPKNLVYPRNASGVYEPAFDVDVEINGPDGKTKIGRASCRERV